MYVSELFRRGIVLPLDEVAEASVRAYVVSETTSVRYLKIPSEELFETLWRLGLFREINARCGTLLDDYEEEMVEPARLGAILLAIDSVAKSGVARQPSVVNFLGQMRALVQEASDLSRPLLFVL